MGFEEKGVEGERERGVKGKGGELREVVVEGKRNFEAKSN